MPFHIGPVYKTIKAVSRKWTSSINKEYQLIDVPADQFVPYASVQISSEEMCAIRCLKDPENDCASFKVEKENGILMCKLGHLVESNQSDVENERIFVENFGELA